MQKRILVISQCFFPEQFRINDVCAEWVNRGYKVTVITGIPNYPKGKFFEGYGLFKKKKEIYKGIEIIRLPIIPRGNNVLMLVMNYFSFIVSGYFWHIFTKIKADYVFMLGLSPITQALPGIWFAKRWKIPCYLYVQDLWPETIEIVGGINNKKILNFIGKIVDYIYSECTRIFTSSESFIKAINDRGVPIDKIEFWPQYAEDFYFPIEKKNVAQIPGDDLFNVIFAGNIGLAQGLDILPKAAEIIRTKSEKKIRFNLLGDGRYKNELLKVIKTKELEDMFNFIPTQPASKIPQFIAASDVAYISLANNSLFEMTIPAKLQSYMACGIPNIASAVGETAKIIKESNSGLTSKPGDAEELAQNIIQLANNSPDELKRLGENAREYYDRHFDKNLLLNKMDFHFGK